VKGRKSANQLAVLEFKLPAQVFAAFEGNEAVKVYFVAGLLDVVLYAGLAGAAINRVAGQLAVFISNLEGLAFLPFGSRLVGRVGNAHPSAHDVLGGQK